MMTMLIMLAFETRWKRKRTVTNNRNEKNYEWNIVKCHWERGQNHFNYIFCRSHFAICSLLSLHVNYCLLFILPRCEFMLFLFPCRVYGKSNVKNRKNAAAKDDIINENMSGKRQEKKNIQTICADVSSHKYEFTYNRSLRETNFSHVQSAQCFISSYFPSRFDFFVVAFSLVRSFYCRLSHLFVSHLARLPLLLFVLLNDNDDFSAVILSRCALFCIHFFFCVSKSVVCVHEKEAEHFSPFVPLRRLSMNLWS